VAQQSRPWQFHISHRYQCKGLFDFQYVYRFTFA